MHKTIRLALFSLAFLTCLGIMDYPFLSRLYNEGVQGTVAVNYETSSEEMEKEKRSQMLLEAQVYNARLAAREPAGLADAFADTVAESKEYEMLLNVEENGVMAVVEIPSIHVTLPVYHGTSEQALQQGAGHLEGSSLPVGGESTHTCLSAHRGLPNKKLFTNLDLLKEGEVFYIRVLNETLAYQVYEIQTVTPDQTEALNICAGEDLATLITCTPYGINTHRLYVHGMRIPYEEAQETLSEASGMVTAHFWELYWWIPVTVMLLLWLAILLIWNWKSDVKQ